MTGDDDGTPVAEASADYGLRSGGFVRLDVRLEVLWDERPPAAAAYGWAALSPDEAEQLAQALLDAAGVARQGKGEGG